MLLNDEREIKERIAIIQEENDRIFEKFLQEEGKLPMGFSCFREGWHTTGTPFDALFEGSQVDWVKDRSGISAWYKLDETADINVAAEAISEWSYQHKKMREFLKERCNVGTTYFFPPFDHFWGKKVMVILAEKSQFESISEESIQKCKAQGISFCVLLPQYELYDLFENSKKSVSCDTYPNYHDETYLDWTLVNSND